ncbi:fatty acid desaturase [Nocardia sp. NBC_00565]|uniref:fatty acid desaturase n=1 Tax=Nocardia sp. NBC_00565 TaxID=2975993 RepID=UPI002E803114|nr:fatty acid desaturase [Nocardia sp. NBC_00565]WUC03471.1 fatty acid desaturase [Nocardia sp. NBC_00565]
MLVATVNLYQSEGQSPTLRCRCGSVTRWSARFDLSKRRQRGSYNTPSHTRESLAAKSGDETWTAATARWTAWLTAAGVAAAVGHLGHFVLFWAAPLIVVRPIVTWLTDLGNHAGLIHNSDPLNQTRGWTSHALTRHLLGGHNDDMFHPLHHWFPNLAWRDLPAAAEILRAEFDRWPEVPWCSGFFFRRRATPEVPSVLDDIVERLRHRSRTGNALP